MLTPKKRRGHEIYRLLLVNILLAESSSVSANKHFKPHAYELSPALLRVSKQLNFEASTILYDQNRFYLAIIYDLYKAFSPIFRYIEGEFRFVDVLMVKKVRQWKIILGRLLWNYSTIRGRLSPSQNIS